MRNGDVVRALVGGAAHLAGDRVRTYQAALLGQISISVNSSDGPDPKAVREFDKVTVPMANAVTENEHVTIEQTAYSVMSVARLRVPKASDMDMALEMSRQVLSQQIRRDQTLARNHLVRIMMASQLKKDGGVEPGKAVRDTAREMRDQLRFTYVDRMNRKYDAASFIENVYQGHLMDIMNWAELNRIRGQGENQAMVDRPGHKTNGTLFVIERDETGLPTYQDIRDKIFHPNSGALVGQIGD